jgi:hypothetical protein
MNHGRFDEPVTILVGMGFPARIENAMEAYALLQDWPALKRSGAHTLALNACKAGVAGDVDPETVRATLIAFARRNDILVENTGPLPHGTDAGAGSGRSSFP